MKITRDVLDLNLLLEQENFKELITAFEQMNTIDLAHYLNSLEESQTFRLLSQLPNNITVEILPELDPGLQVGLIHSFGKETTGLVFEALSVDDAVDIIQDLPKDLADKILESLSSETRSVITEYMGFHKDSVGSVMTPEFTCLNKDMNVKQAIDYIRKTGASKESIYMCYVVDMQNKLIGVLSIRDLLTASDTKIIAEIMKQNIVSVNTGTDKEEAAYMLSKYNFISLPVVNIDNALVGIITFDDAADIIIEETTEDIEKMAGMTPSETPYLKTGMLNLARNRILWLFVLMLSGIVSEAILAHYENTISIVPLLAAFIPLLTDMGGDAGSQVSALIIRGCALDEIYNRHIPKMLAKEFLVSFMVGIPLAIINFLRIVIEYPNDVITALAISITLICTLLMANILGVILPMFAQKIKIDPALMATPMIATLVDILSILIYFAIATVMIF